MTVPSPILDGFRAKIENLAPATYDTLKAVVGPEIEAYVFGGVPCTQAFVERALSALASIEAGTSAAVDASQQAQDVPTEGLQRRIDEVDVACPALPPTLPHDDYVKAEGWVASQELAGDPWDEAMYEALVALKRRVQDLPADLADTARRRIAVEAGFAGFAMPEDERRNVVPLEGMTYGRFVHMTAIVCECEAEAEARTPAEPVLTSDATLNIPRAADLPPAREPNITPDPLHPPEGVKDVKAWVELSPLGSPTERARMALQVETARTKPRATLVKWLGEFVGLHERLDQAVAHAEAGNLLDLGDFTQYAEDDDKIASGDEGTLEAPPSAAGPDAGSIPAPAASSSDAPIDASTTTGPDPSPAVDEGEGVSEIAQQPAVSLAPSGEALVEVVAAIATAFNALSDKIDAILCREMSA